MLEDLGPPRWPTWQNFHKRPPRQDVLLNLLALGCPQVRQYRRREDDHRPGELEPWPVRQKRA
jgi:hypothetical protein